MSVNTDLRARREAIVREHAESENRHEFDVTLATFDHPRYELIPTGEVHDGPEEVMDYFEETRRAFPDQRNENAVLHHTDDAVGNRGHGEPLLLLLRDSRHVHEVSRGAVGVPIGRMEERHGQIERTEPEIVWIGDRSGNRGHRNRVDPGNACAMDQMVRERPGASQLRQRGRQR